MWDEAGGCGRSRPNPPRGEASRRSASASVRGYLDRPPDYTIDEVEVPERRDGRTLGELELRAKFGVNVLLILRDSQLLISPSTDARLQRGDVLVVVGENRQLNRLESVI